MLHWFLLVFGVVGAFVGASAMAAPFLLPETDPLIARLGPEGPQLAVFCGAIAFGSSFVLLASVIRTLQHRQLLHGRKQTARAAFAGLAGLLLDDFVLSLDQAFSDFRNARAQAPATEARLSGAYVKDLDQMQRLAAAAGQGLPGYAEIDSRVVVAREHLRHICAQIRQHAQRDAPSVDQLDQLISARLDVLRSLLTEFRNVATAR